MKIIACLPLIAPLISAIPRNDERHYRTQKEITFSEKDWVTLENGVEFQPGNEFEPSMEHVRRLWGGADKDNGQQSLFVDGSEMYYDEYAQAWRLLGFYMDCDQCSIDDVNYNEAYCVQNGIESVCQRYLLWAAYVDPGYSGGGAGEYMYYDRTHRTWNNTACKQSGNKRCVKLDCHEPNSRFKLLGIFKEPNYSDFFQVLSQNQGDCVWTDKEYETVQSNQVTLPDGCTQVGDSEDLYYDVKPLTGGDVTIGLYTDAQCSQEYTGDTTVSEALAQANNDDGNNGDDNANGDQTYPTEEEWSAWNDAMDAFKICQPCRTTNLVSVINKGEEANSDGNRYEYTNNDNADDGNAFTCSGNNYVNQCKLFRTDTNMYTATYHDVAMAEQQGTVTSVSMGGVTYGESEERRNHKWERHLLSALFMIVSFSLFVCSMGHCLNEVEENDFNRPLVKKSGARGSRGH